MNQPYIDLDKEYGVVLEGGGAKGAYQIGAWKALKECNVKIKGVAGVSVGALNGALICMDDVEAAENIWHNITYSQIMQVDDQEMDSLVNGDLKSIGLPAITKKGLKLITDRGIDIAPLRQLIEECVDEEKIQQSDIQFLLGTLSISDLKELELDAKELAPGELKDYLVASASLPGFKREKYQGKSYLDGGMVNNVPIDMLVNRGYKDILVIRIYGIGVERKLKLPEDVTLIQIAPRVNLGSILEFSKTKARRNIKIGYLDAMRVLKNLQGKIYYLDEVESEEAYGVRFLKMDGAVKMAFLEYFKDDYSKEQQNYHKFMDIALPKVAEKLGLDKNWTYQELYLAMLELAAKSLRVIKYQIYTVKEFQQEIIAHEKKYGERMDTQDLFVKLVIKAVVIDAKKGEI